MNYCLLPSTKYSIPRVGCNSEENKERKKSLLFVHTSSSRAWAQRFLPGGEKDHKQFTGNKVWRSFNLKLLLKTVEVVVKGNCKEIIDPKKI